MDVRVPLAHRLTSKRYEGFVIFLYIMLAILDYWNKETMIKLQITTAGLEDKAE